MATRGSAKAARVSVSPDSKAKGGKRGPKVSALAACCADPVSSPILARRQT